MPGGDGTGPLGAGPMTGRGAGFCVGSNMPGYANPVPGRGYWNRGFGRGGGGGRGWRHWYRATGLPGWMRFGWGMQTAPAMSPSDAERSMLQSQAEILQQQLDAVRQRLDALAANADAVKP
ncbi:MAG TPA: DUF5320 domain-containing protein [Candidatus Hydrogenedentes bacterium]|nr:DUF5320 domain-containing protein [Candidatus Hydrogenedentota bacterium]HRT19940.1 DUF5320 domain-containing protein [Candidatus Hydrogenedentota bacterium]HRT64618.1 DUF5320 domain-containing protein [Candidatus Hydrogenedentota bacterium]